MAAPAHDVSQIFLELGAAIVGLAVLARLATRFGFSAIPLYLLAGLAFGNGGLAPLDVSQSFIHTGAEIGVLLLLFMLGVEYTGEELKHSLRVGLPAGAMDFALNFTPGLVAGFILGFSPLMAVLAMAIYLPLVAVLIAFGSLPQRIVADMLVTCTVLFRPPAAGRCTAVR